MPISRSVIGHCATTFNLKVKAIQWAAYQNDETMLINYDMIDRLLVDYFDDRQTEDFDIEHNRLRHSLVEIFGFNEIPKENIRQHKTDLQYPDFFNELEECGKLLTWLGWIIWVFMSPFTI